MAANFTVEDGTGLADSNAYVSTAFVDQYLEDRGRNVAWRVLSGADKQAAIVRASDYVDSRWQMRGTRGSADQAMEAPRSEAYRDDSSGIDGVPAELQEATAEYALLEATGTTLLPNPVYETSGHLLTRKETEAGGSKGRVRIVREFADSGSPKVWRKYARADAKMRPIVVPRGGVVR